MIHRSGLSVTAYVRAERGVSNPAWTTVLKIAAALDVTIMELAQATEVASQELARTAEDAGPCAGTEG